ncbi:hypothetical protein SEVIR_5G078350v4 [Setaria viridis]
MLLYYLSRRHRRRNPGLAFLIRRGISRRNPLLLSGRTPVPCLPAILLSGGFFCCWRRRRLLFLLPFNWTVAAWINALPGRPPASSPRWCPARPCVRVRPPQACGGRCKAPAFPVSRAVNAQCLVKSSSFFLDFVACITMRSTAHRAELVRFRSWGTLSSPDDFHRI